MAILGLGVVAAQSLSKAAMISFIVLVLAALWYQGMSARLKLVTAVGLVIGGAVISGMYTSPSIRSNSVVERVAARFESIGKDADDSAEQRGYDRIWLYPEYLLYGAGEGAEERFGETAGGDIEMHSTFGTVLFSYGIFGFGLFLLFLWIIFRRAPHRQLVYFAPICLYGLTHQGLRFSLMWVFLGTRGWSSIPSESWKRKIGVEPICPGRRLPSSIWSFLTTTEKGNRRTTWTATAAGSPKVAGSCAE